MSTCSSKKRQRCQLNDNATEDGQPSSKKHRANNPNSTTSSSSCSTDNVWSSPESCLSWLISKDDSNSESTNTLNDFVTNYWSQKPYLLQRNNSDYYNSKGV